MMPRRVRNGYRNPNTGQVYYNFKPPHGIARKPIKGGRWEVRRMRYFDGWSKPIRWRAATKGKASFLNLSFDTQREAIEWAQTACWAYSNNHQHFITQLLEMKRYKSKHGLSSLTWRWVDGKIEVTIHKL